MLHDADWLSYATQDCAILWSQAGILINTIPFSGHICCHVHLTPVPHYDGVSIFWFHKTSVGGSKATRNRTACLYENVRTFPKVHASTWSKLERKSNSYVNQWGFRELLMHLDPEESKPTHLISYSLLLANCRISLLVLLTAHYNSK